MAENEVKLRKDGTPKVPLSTFEKTVIAISVVLVVLTAVCGFVKWGFSRIQLTSMDDLSGKGLVIDETTLDFLDLIVPEEMELDGAADGAKFTVKLEVNREFDQSKTSSIFDYIDLINLYDWDGNPVGDDDSIQVYNIKGSQLKLTAIVKIAEKLVKVKEAVNNTLIVLILLDIVAAVFITYFIWKRADDRRELREQQLMEQNVKKVSGLSEEEARQSKSKKKKKKKK